MVQYNKAMTVDAWHVLRWAWRGDRRFFVLPTASFTIFRACGREYIPCLQASLERRCARCVYARECLLVACCWPVGIKNRSPTHLRPHCQIHGIVNHDPVSLRSYFISGDALVMLSMPHCALLNFVSLNVWQVFT